MEKHPPKAPDDKPMASPQAQTLRIRGYTRKFSGLAFVGLFFLAMRDMEKQQASQLLLLFGLNSAPWGWFWLAAGGLLTFWIAGRISLNAYVIYAVKDYKDSEPINPIEAGTVDVAFWATCISYMGTLLLAALLPGGPSWLRPPAIILVSMIGAFALSALFTNRIVRGIYGNKNLRETISRHQCDMETIKGGRCQNWALRSSFRVKVDSEEKEFCRWHYISIIAVQKNLKRRSPEVFNQILAAMCLLYGLIGVWSFVVHRDVIWLAVFTLAFGAGIRYFAESIIAPWQALSRLAIWSKLFATGVTLEVLGGIAFIVMVAQQHEVIQPVVRLFGSGSDWLVLGPPVVYLVIAFIVALSIDAFVRRILLYRTPSFASMIVMVAFLPLWNMFESGLRQHWLFGRWMSDQFWQEVIGGEVRVPLGLALLSGFFLAHSLLRRRKAEEDAESTFVAYFASLTNFFVPVLVGIVSILASRYALGFLGVVGPVPFVVATVIVSIPLTLLVRLFRRDSPQRL